MTKDISTESLNIYRPVIDTGWAGELSEYLKQEFENQAALYKPETYRVRIVKRRELASLSISNNDAKSRVEAAMPPTFISNIDVACTGIGYFKKRGAGALIVKIADDARLHAENDAVFDSLSRFGAQPSGHLMYYSALIGGVALQHLAGPEKVRLRFGLSDIMPATVTLGAGTIDTHSEPLD